MRVASLLLLSIAALSQTPPISAASGVVVEHNAVASSSSLTSTPAAWLTQRHGDHGHDEEGSHGQTDHDDPHHTPAPSASLEHTHTSVDAHSHGHAHSHTPDPHVSTIEEAGLRPLAIPDFPHAKGGHTHAHSDAPAELHLNESKLLKSKGPEPLSYIEWDFAYGMGSIEALRRFTSPEYTELDATQEKGAMGALDGRFRTLLDEKDPQARKAIVEDIASRLEGDQPTRHKWLLILHVAGAMLSCFVLLPLALFLRAAESSLAPLASLVYLASLAGSLVLSSLYKALSPQLYPKNVHGKMGWIILWISAICLGGDVFRLLSQIAGVLRGGSSSSKLRNLLHLATGGSSSEEKYSAVEEERMLGDEEEDNARHHRVHFALSASREGSLETLRDDGHRWAQRHDSGEDGSISPSSTLVGANATSGRNNSFTEMLAQKLPWKLRSPSQSYHDGSGIESWRSNAARSPSPPPIVPARSRRSTLLSILRYTHVTVSRSLPIISFAAVYTGLAVYTGTCRKPNQNGCLAHGIKGGIFFWYGLLTFARYLGAYAECGWAWNRRPAHTQSTSRKGGQAAWKAKMPSAEWVECAVIFTYGATNTWMERFDAKPGDPYSVKQVQHISIAVMYWFAGALGVLLETKWVKDLLSFPVALNHPAAAGSSATLSRRRGSRSSPAQEDEEPLVAAQASQPSYSGSFNPFPALCIGVTGLAMSAHHQDYIYEVSIHSLWGNLLAAFALLRFLTYFFLFLRPPTASILPSRPPTEALASFALASGGLVFMISSEEVSFAAMRNGFGDFMAILCVTVAVICFVFAWIAGLFVIKAWAVRREYRREAKAVGGDMRMPTRRPNPRRASAAPLGAVDEQEEQRAAGEGGEPVFVLGEDGEEEAGATSSTAPRQLSQSPDNLV